MVFIAIILGMAIGGFPAYGNEIATICLILAMTISIADMPLKIDIKKEVRGFFYAFLLNYVFLSSLILLMGFLTKKYWEGFVVMASAPPAIAIVPISSILKGEKDIIFSIIFLYLVSIFLMPLMIFIFLAKEINFTPLIKNIFLLILLPILLSRIFPKSDRMPSILLFFVIFAIVGENREFILQSPSILLVLCLVMTIRTFGIAKIVRIISKKFGIENRRSINYALFSSFKNEGLTMLIASSLFGYEAAIPSIVALIFEMLLVCCMEAKIF